MSIEGRAAVAEARILAQLAKLNKAHPVLEESLSAEQMALLQDMLQSGFEVPGSWIWSLFKEVRRRRRGCPQ